MGSKQKYHRTRIPTQAKREAESEGNIQRQASSMPNRKRLNREEYFAKYPDTRAKKASNFVPNPNKQVALSSPGDASEKQADDVADKVMRQQEVGNISATTENVQTYARSYDENSHDEQHSSYGELNENYQDEFHSSYDVSAFIARQVFDRAIDQQSEEAANSPEFEAGLQNSTGTSMEPEVQADMEESFGQDFSDVKIHQGNKANELSESINAKAFATGNDIYFKEGAYNPKSSEGKRLLAHELTHTVEQGGQKGSTKRKINRYSWDDFTSDVGGVYDATAGKVVDYASDKVQEGAETIVNRLAPGLLPFLRSDIVASIKDKIFGSIDTYLAAQISKVSNLGITGWINSTFGAILSGINNSAAYDTSMALAKAAQSIITTGKELTGQAFNSFVTFLKGVGKSISSVVSDLLGPAIDGVKKYAGAAWDWISSKVNWLWAKIEPIRNAVGSAWSWLKSQFGFGSESGSSSIWDWIKEKATKAWEAVKSFFNPIINFLKEAGRFILGLAVDQIKTIFSAVKSVWGFLKWIATSFWNSEIIVTAREYIRDTIIPGIRNAVDVVSGAIASVRDFYHSIIDRIKATFVSMLSIIAAPFKKTISVVSQLIANATVWTNTLKAKIDQVRTAVKTKLTKLWDAISPILKTVGGIIIILTNPGLAIQYLAAWTAKLAWSLIPQNFKEYVLNWIADKAVQALEYLPNVVSIGLQNMIWILLKNGLLGFMKVVKSKTGAEKAQFIETLFDKMVNPSLYLGFFIGILKGIVWDSILSIVVMIFDLIRSLPGYISSMITFFTGSSSVERSSKVTEIERQEDSRGSDGPQGEKTPEEQKGVSLLEQAQSILSDLADAESSTPATVDKIIKFFSEVPGKFMDMLSKFGDKAAEWAEKGGQKIANAIEKYLGSDAYKVGYDVGVIAGQIIFEVALAAFTAGIGTAAVAALKSFKLVKKGMSLMKTASGAGGKLVIEVFTKLKGVAGDVMNLIRNLFQSLGKAFSSVMKVVDDVFEWFAKRFDDMKRIAKQKADELQEQLLKKKKQANRKAKKQADPSIVDDPDKMAALAFGIVQAEMYDRMDPSPYVGTVVGALNATKLSPKVKFHAENAKGRKGAYFIYMRSSPKSNLTPSPYTEGSIKNKSGNLEEAANKRRNQPYPDNTGKVEPDDLGKATAKGTKGEIDLKYWKEPQRINGRKVYQRDDLFDPNFKDAKGRTNVERMEKGLSPIGFDNKEVNLHHLTQTEPGPIAEVGGKFHSENTGVIHVKGQKSFRRPDGRKADWPKTRSGKGYQQTQLSKDFDAWRKQYWKDRALDFK